MAYTVLRSGLRLLPALAVVLLASCGGGDDDGGSAAGGGGGGTPGDPLVAGTQVPQSATASSAGAFAFVKATAATSGETGEPLVVGNATLGSSESEEAQPL